MVIVTIDVIRDSLDNRAVGGVDFYVVGRPVLDHLNVEYPAVFVSLIFGTGSLAADVLLGGRGGLNQTDFCSHNSKSIIVWNFRCVGAADGSRQHPGENGKGEIAHHDGHSKGPRGNSRWPQVTDQELAKY